MNDLAYYPRPVNDTGWGMHDSPGADRLPGDGSPAAILIYARYLRQVLGGTWFKVLAAGRNKVALVKIFDEAGIECIVRLYAPRPHPGYVVSFDDVAAYVAAGAHYFEWGNEGNLRDEWDEAAWARGAQPDQVGEQWLRNQAVIRQAGGIPLLPALSPGGHYPHRSFYSTLFEWLKIHGHLASLEGAAVAIHNRPLNHPLDYQDRAGEPAPGCHFLDYEWIDDLVRRYLGHSLPLLGAEAGYEPGWKQDPRYAEITPVLHAELNLAIFDGFRSGKWRDSLFCQCMWYVDSFGHEHAGFAPAAWHNNRVYGGDLPAVGAVKADWSERPFVRRLGKPPEEPVKTFYADGRYMRLAEFAQHVAALPERKITRIVMHHTAKPTLEDWRKWGGWAHYKDEFIRYYRDTKGWTVGPHLFVDEDGVGLLTPLSQDGAGASGFNAGAWHVEVVGDYTKAAPAGAILDNALSVAAILLRKAGLGTLGLTYHKRLTPALTECPGAAWISAWAWFRDLAAAALQPAPELPEDLTATDPATMAEKARWWAEELERQEQAGNRERAGAIRSSLIKLMYRLEDTLKKGQ